MGWATAAFIVGAIIASEASSSASDSAADSTNKMVGSAANSLDFQKAVYAEQQAYNAPIKEWLRGKVIGPDAEESMGFGLAKGQIEEGYARAGREAESNLAMAGVGGSGLEEGAIVGSSLRKASDLSRQFEAGKIKKIELATQLMNQDKTMQAAGGVAQAQSGVTQAYGTQANGFTQEANGLGSLASDIAKNGMYAWQMGKTPTANTGFSQLAPGMAAPATSILGSTLGNSNQLTDGFVGNNWGDR